MAWELFPLAFGKFCGSEKTLWFVHSAVVLVRCARGDGVSSLRGRYLNFAPEPSRFACLRQKVDESDGNWITLSFPPVRRLRYFDQAALVVFDLTNRASFARAHSILGEIRQAKVLVGTKCDLVDQREVSRQEAEQLAAQHGVEYFEVTATNYDSTRAPFVRLARKLNRAQEEAMSALIRAASDGNVAAIEQAVGKGVNQTDQFDQRGCTAMHHAARNGRVFVIEALIRLASTGLLPDLTDTPDKKDGWTPMMTAAHFGHVSVIERLVRLGSKAIDTPDKEHGQTPMYAAASNGHESVVETLVRLGSNAIDTPDSNGWTPLNAAAENGHASIIELLVHFGSKAIDTPNHGNTTPLHSAVEKGHVSVIETLIRLGSKIIDTHDKYGHTFMLGAAALGHTNVIEALVRLGSKAIDTKLASRNGDFCCTPLCIAARKGHASAVEALVRLGSNAIDTPDNDGRTPMIWAVAGGHVSVIETLVRLGSSGLDALDGSMTCSDGKKAIRVFKVLKALGVSHPLANESSACVSELEVEEIRFRVYFSRSLVDLLLFALGL